MSRPIAVTPGKNPKLSHIDADDTGGLSKAKAAARLAGDRERIREAQERLYAENRRALVVVLQGMDTSGKDGTIKSVFTAVNPVGFQLGIFGRPSEEELEHDFLWRAYQKLPRFGNVGVFNRSYYEDVLVVRVKKLAPRKVWKERYAQINAFEKLISDLGYELLKFYLHIDRAEQKRRLEARLEEPTKRHKFQLSDLEDRAYWGEFEAAYEDALGKCSTRVAPWHIVPANKQWHRDAVIARTVADKLEAMKPELPRLTFDPGSVKIPD
jgi:PPK2 family polyphosphate:nucleotide phosphotransferase